MERYIILIVQILFLAVSAWADTMVEVFCFTSGHDNGRGGMRVAWRGSESEPWTVINNGRGVVRSDFGSLKSMYDPFIDYDGIELKAYWNLDKEGTGMAVTSSSDMVVWVPQHFFNPQECLSSLPKPHFTTELIDGETLRGSVCRIPSRIIYEYSHAAELANVQNIGRGERLTDDSVKYAGLLPLKAVIKIDFQNPIKGSDMLIGAFFEDLNYAADGGLYAELIQNRDFEYSKLDQNKDPDWDSLYAWEPGGSAADWQILTDDPLHFNNPHFLRLFSKGDDTFLKNKGYEGICVKQGEKYDFSMFLRNHSGKEDKIRLYLCKPDGSVIANKSISIKKGNEWLKATEMLVAKVDCDSAYLELRFPSGIEVDLDMISLFPCNTFKGRKNGLRMDLAQTIAAIKPKFIRFPGGCLVHGDGIDNIYHWKETIGELESRKPAANIWRYHQTRGLGYFEYFQFCEDIGAEPLPVVAAGVSCQNSGISGPSHHTHDLITSYGQQGGIPMDEMDSYIQDILDLVEWANGDKTTKWGSMRAQAGHPEPFNLKYLGVGNEDLISPVFISRFKMIYDTLKKTHPEITVIGTSGPFVSGSDYEAGWELAKEMRIPVIDEHNYNSPGWYINNTDFYDSYPRDRAAVYLGEYAVHHPKRISTVETALCTALFLTGVERNSDIVKMTSYAPLLARLNHTQWNPNLIYFDGKEVFPTVDYEVQKIFGNASGDMLVPTSITFDSDDKDVIKRIGVSTLVDSKSGITYLKIVNLLPVEIAACIEMEVSASKRVERTVLRGNPEDRDSRQVSDMLNPDDILNASYPPYSLTVYKIIN